jgi:carbon-monoxide dehydrogenase large subunit
MRASPKTLDAAVALAGQTGPSVAPNPIGASRLRREDARLITGQGCYVSDLSPKACLHAVFVRSPVARAKLTGIDPVNAMAMPGTVAVFTGAQFASLPPHRVNPVIEEAGLPPVPVLAGDDIYAAGQPLALVVATSLDVALDAAEAVEIGYDPLDPVICPRQAADHAPLYRDIASNTAARHVITSGDIDAAFADADIVVDADCGHPRLFPAPMEGRATLAEWNASDGILHVHASSQTPHRFRDEIARALRLDTDDVMVVAPDVGGAFGGKASVCAEDIAVCFAARHLGRPVKWVAQRSEDFLSAAQGRGALCDGQLALSSDGRMLGLRANLLFPLGWWVPFSGLVPAWNAARILPGPYDVPAVDIAAKAVMTNSPPIGIYRGAGRPEAAMLLETLVDKAAGVLGMDPYALRQRNLRSANSLPCPLPGGALLDSGDYHAALSRAAALASESFAAGRPRTGTLRGTGVGMFVEPCGQGWESARITLEKSGRISLATGSTAQGQGRETAFAQIAARALGRSESDIDVIHGQTDKTPNGIGALASRSTAIGGSAVVKCAERLLTRLKTVAAAFLDCLPEDILVGEERVQQRNNPANQLSWSALASAMDAPMSAEVDYEVDHEAWSYGCCMAEVEIDSETGRLDVTRLVFCDDSGTAVNPMLIEGQIHGGIAQGLGEACLEQVVQDDQGQLLSGSLMDYALPRADDMPELFTSRLQTPSLFNALGARGVGEAGTIGTQPAIINAVRDALKDYDVSHLDLPLTSEKLWRILAQGPVPKEQRSGEKNR